MDDAFAAAQAVIQCALALMFVAAGAPKILGLGRIGGNWRKFGLPQPAWRAVGAAELLGAAGLVAGVFVARRFSNVAAVGLTALMIGALGAHLRVRDKPAEMVSAVIALVGSAGVLAANAWAWFSFS